MSLKSLMSYTFVSKYARWDSKKLRRETWAESVDRVRQMMVDKYVDDSKDSRAITKAIDQAYDDMKKKKILGSQRALQFGGSPVFKHNARIHFCCSLAPKNYAEKKYSRKFKIYTKKREIDKHIDISISISDISIRMSNIYIYIYMSIVT